MIYKDASLSPPRYQWEPSSGTSYASQSNNCGPTSVTKIADFYNNAHYGIEATRYLATSCCQPTTCTQQASMLTSRGVPSIALWLDRISDLDYLVGWDGRHPVLIGMLMSRIPTYIKDHPFDGWHALVVLKRVERNGVSGYLVNDPNFSPPGGYRPDPDKGRKFYPRWAIDYGFFQNSPRWAVVPNKTKQIAKKSHRIVGDPASMGKLFINELGHNITIKRGKPIRAGYTVKDRVLKVTENAAKRQVVGRIPLSQLPISERQYGPVFVINQWARDNLSRHGYVKGIDIVSGSYD